VGTAFAEQFGVTRPEGPSWLSEVRTRAMARFQSAGYPTTKNEDWHFTNPSPIAEATFEPMRAPTAALAAESWRGASAVGGRASCS
jgi:Fe-S cluster assembly protein SufD